MDDLPTYPIAVVSLTQQEVLPQWRYPDVPFQARTVQHSASLEILDHEEVARIAQNGTTIAIAQYYDRRHAELSQARIETLLQEHAFHVDDLNSELEGLVRWIEDDRRLIEAGRDRERRLDEILDEGEIALSAAHVEVDEKITELLKKQGEVAALESKVSSVKAELEEKQTKVAELESKVSSTNAELATEKEQTGGVRKANEQLRLKVSDLETQLQNERKQIDLQSEDFKRATAKHYDDLKRCNDDLEKQKGLLRDSRSQLDDAQRAKERSETDHKVCKRAFSTNNDRKLTRLSLFLIRKSMRLEILLQG